MALIPTPYQPLGFTHRPADNCDCDETIAYLLEENDTIYAQFTQTPCGDNLLCDGAFTGITGEMEHIADTNFTALSGELLQNGSFTGSAASWTLTNFTYGSDAITKSNAAVFGGAEQILPVQLVKNAMYKVQFTVSNHSGGSIRAGVRSPSDNINIWASPVSGNGTFTFYIKNTGNSTVLFILSTVNSSWTGTIDDVSIRRIASLWDFSTGYTMDQASGIVNTIGTTTVPLTYGGALLPYTPYQVEIDFNGNGGVTVELGGTLANVQTVTGAQTKTWSIVSGATTVFRIRVDSGYLGEVLNVSVKNLNEDCWAIDETQWNINSGMLCKIQGIASAVENIHTHSAGLYQGFITVDGMSAGSLTVSLDGVNHLITSNGRHEFYYNTQNSASLTIYADAAFNGCIRVAELYKLKTDYVFTLVNAAGNDIAYLDDYVSYYNQYVTIKFKLSEIDSEDIINDNIIGFGCYRLRVYDTCEIQYSQIWNDTGVNNPIGVWWDKVTTYYPEITLSASTGQMIVQATSPANNIFYYIKNYSEPFAVNQQFPLQIPAGMHNYRATLDIISNTDPDNIKVGVFAGGSTGGYTSASTPGNYTVDIMNYDPTMADPAAHYMWIVVRFMNGTTGTVILDNLRLNRVEPYTASYESRLILYRENHPCTTLIRAWSEFPSYGYEFMNTGFYLQQRIPVKAISPEYPQFTSVYLYSTGTRVVTAGQHDKQWVLIVDYSPEEVHDTIAVQRICRHFEIENGGTFYDYYCESGEYQPEWNPKVSTRIATGRFKIGLKNDAVKFMRN